MILPFLPERINIGKCQKPVCNLYSKKNITYKTLKWVLDHGLEKLEKVRRVIDSQSRSMAEPLHRHGARREGLLQVDEQFCVRKNDRKCREAQRYQTVRNDKQRN